MQPKEPRSFLRPVSKPTPRSRLVTLCSIHHIDPGGRATSAIIKHSAPLQSDEQPYVRVLNVGSDFGAVDLGWLAETPLSSLVIHNRGSVPLEVSDSPSGPASWIIKPGRALIGTPAPNSKLFLRCADRTTVTITAAPE